jgi:protein-disulfide isomerase
MTDQDEKIIISLKTLLISFSILLAGIMVSAAIFFGLRASPRQENQRSLAKNSPSQAPTQPQPASPGQSVKTTIDNDAFLGNRKTAQIAIVEFSDYECPFCNRFRLQTLPQIKENYLDSGQAIFVYRDLPLPFHNPAAEQEAMAAECAREQGGDDVYFQYHDQIFETSPGNGQGIDLEGLVGLGTKLGLDDARLRSCLTEEKYKDEVAKDIADAAQAGISGTPGFVIGRLDSQGNVEGTIVTGAQPFSNFQSIIEQELN